MTTLEKFEIELKNLIEKPTGLRPFVCNGSPLECKVFIVGFNPASSMSTDFWNFWTTQEGFDKSKWFEEYKKERQLSPLRPGKKRRNTVSNSRRVIEWVLEGASTLQCLETNIYARATEQAADLKTELRIATNFDFLVKKIKPLIIVTHGRDAESHIQSTATTAKIISVPHFSRGWSKEKALALGLRINTEYDLLQLNSIHAEQSN
ncbi:hypothetical protein [Undibacterium umbellatum]|uniref:Uracil-DNA glycosylase-like domain-containing protein n=1 Tax=Undibacterium umbellatum TaxID=2762300 RepID=A0ABR6ZD46_9BURK|nr:hypothetical protein [Undibacterium umbellatum]MBC3909660.1 hypothetical protein [Undibacterium umbellatum]